MTTTQMTHPKNTSLVSTQWLDSHRHDDNLKLIDASWYLPAMQRNAYEEYSAAHIKGAVFFDLDKICDTTADAPHMAPSADTFTAWLNSVGINSSHAIVVYDGAGLFSAARVWWLFRLMGFNNVAVLDGGLPKWIGEGRSTTDVISQVMPYVSSSSQACALQPIMKTSAQVLQAIECKDYQVLDARAPGRFLGAEPEPRKGLRSGHIPGSKNVFFKTLLHHDHTMKSPEELSQVFLAAGADIADTAKPIITSCGSGVTAAIVNLALVQMGKSQHYLYDGSWAQWGFDDALPIATGATSVT